MLFNKWIKTAMDAIIALSGAAATFDWTSVVSQKTAAGIATGIAVVRMVMSSLAPAAGTTVTAPTVGQVVNTK